ncbi:MAG TPA: acyl-CoA dehydrogenase family protein [Thermoanaerobaculia bacterium]|nr:acyl-CoA dehydrogenase family protein [Thermoanaerobaculia bacterium]HEV8610383.1 acyl-CoA dehydrogenase family protein [Thermoanaerobaculia bacterium]
MSAKARPAPEILASPVKALFAGGVLEEALFPFPEPAADEKETVTAFVGAFREFARDRIDSARIDREKAIPPEVIRGLADLGMFGIAVPEEYGGYSFSSSAYCRVMEEIGRTDASLGILVGGHQSIGLKALLLYGSPEQKTRWLPSLAAGEKIAAFALTEPEAGSDAASIRTAARYDSAKDEFVLDGSKHWISNGGIAGFFTVFAKDVALDAKDEHRRITAFAVTRDLPGLEIGPEERKLGLRGSSTVPLLLKDVRVPASNVIGSRGSGFKIAVEVLNTGRTSLGAGCVGGSKVMIREAVLHARERRQFGTRIADFEMIRGKFARMVVNTYALESLVYMTAGLVDRGLSDYSLEGAACKVFGTESVWNVINDALQIAGGNGFMEEYPYGRALRDSRVNMIFEGTNEILRVLIALSGLREIGSDLEEVGRALKTPLSNLGILSDYVGRKIRGYVARERIESVAPELAAEADIVTRYVRSFAAAAETFLSRFGKNVLEREYQQERLANVAVDLYASLAVLSRATSSVRRNGPEKAAEEIRIARVFVQTAKYRIVGELKEMEKNRDRERAAGRDAERSAIAESAYGGPGYRFDLW